MSLARFTEAYAGDFGWCIFPLLPGGKEPLISTADGGRGHLDATNDLVQIREWWRRWPSANIGLSCGSSGIAVVDTDTKYDGPAKWAEIRKEVPHTVQAVTGSGGEHIFFRAQFDSCKLVKPGVDLKSVNGYVVLAPSIHPNGRRYQWELTALPSATKVAPAPDWLAELIRKRRFKSSDRPRHQAPVDPETFFLGQLFMYAGMLGRQHSVRHGTFAVECPWLAQHTDHSELVNKGRTAAADRKVFNFSSVIFAPDPGASGPGLFRCEHSHHEGSFRDVCVALDADALRAARRAA